MIYVLLSTGLRREELIRLDLDQVSPKTPATLRQSRQRQIARVQGLGNTKRSVFLSDDARLRGSFGFIARCCVTLQG